MAVDDPGDLLNMLLDNDSSWSSSITPETKHPKRRTRKHSRTSLKCVVCGDHAEGYNFDAISCESCKAFFRRNALRPPGRLKCRGNGHCAITVETRKRCKKCRLDKCFRMGMRKDWILSEDEKKKKRRKIEENRRRRTNQPSKLSTSSTSEDTGGAHPEIDLRFQMTESDWSKTEQVRSAYEESIVLNRVIGVPLYPATQPIHSTLELIRIPTYLASIRLITYLKKNPEFEQFDAEDRVTLVKHNLLAVVFMHTVLLYDPNADTYHERNTEDPIFRGQDWADILGQDFYEQLTDTVKKVIQILGNDDVMVKIFLLVILFTKGFCAYDIEHEPSLNQPAIVLQSHNQYTELLYKYSVNRFGLHGTVMMFTQLINPLLMIQRLAIRLKDLVHSDISAADLSPLMQSLLQLNDSNG